MSECDRGCVEKKYDREYVIEGRIGCVIREHVCDKRTYNQGHSKVYYKRCKQVYT